MARRNEGFLDLIAELPWWAGVTLSAITYVGLRFVLPAVWPPNGSTEGSLAQIAAQFSPIFALILLAAAGVSALKGAVRGHRATKERGARLAQGVGACPKCGSQLVLRVAKQGANAGGKFWGCSSFPKCRYIQDYVG